MNIKKLFLFASLIIACTVCPAQSKKSVSILGDSYSTFQGYLQPDTNYVWYNAGKHYNTDVTAVQQTWWHRLISNRGLRLCVNNSFSGATICNTGYNKDDYSDRSFCTRLWNLGFPDIIFIFGGTNDSWASSPIGEYKYSGWTKDDLYSFRPAMAYMLDNTIARYPNTEIYVIINDGLSEDITESSRAICEHYKVRYVMLENIDKMNGHPSVKGMEQIAEQVEKIIPNR